MEHRILEPLLFDRFRVLQARFAVIHFLATDIDDVWKEGQDRERGFVCLAGVQVFVHMSNWLPLTHSLTISSAISISATKQVMCEEGHNFCSPSKTKGRHKNEVQMNSTNISSTNQSRVAIQTKKMFALQF